MDKPRTCFFCLTDSLGCKLFTVQHCQESFFDPYRKCGFVICPRCSAQGQEWIAREFVKFAVKHRQSEGN